MYILVIWKVTAIKLRNKVFTTGRGKKGNYQHQYIVDGDFVARYGNIYAASETLGIYYTNILAIINKK